MLDKRYCYIGRVKANIQLACKLKYIILLEIVPSDKSIYRFIGRQWSGFGEEKTRDKIE